MTITEPMTMVTDYLLAVACTAFALRTSRLSGDHRARVLWLLTFVTGALAALLGGTHHGFKRNLSVGQGKTLWDFTMISIGASAAFMIAATIVSSLRHSELPHVKWLKRGLVVSAVGFAIQKIGWDLHPGFNHNDLFHVIQIAGFWCLYAGVRRM